MTKKLTTVTLLWLALMCGLAVGVSNAHASVHDGQRCGTEMRSTWRMAPDECHWVTEMGGFMWLSRACTEVDVWMYGKRLRQRRFPNGSYGFGMNRAEGQPMIAFRPRDRFFVNGDRAPVKVFCWHS